MSRTNGKGETLLTKEQIIAADDLPSVVVPVPEWGGKVRLIGLTMRQKTEIAKTYEDRKNKFDMADFRQRCLLHGLVDMNGQRVFTDDEIDELSGKSSVVLERLYSEWEDLNASKPKAQKRLLKNSDAHQGDASFTA